MIVFDSFLGCCLPSVVYLGNYLAGKEHLLVIPNHRSDVDWLVGWILAEVHHHLSSNLI